LPLPPQYGPAPRQGMGGWSIQRREASMFAWRVVAGVGLLLAVSTAGRAQTVTLAEPLKAGDCFRLQLEMKLAGEMRIEKGGELKSIKLEAGASHVYPERVLALGAGNAVEKTA